MSNHSQNVETRFNDIIELIQQLTPQQRRLLQKRLRVIGLWETEDTLTDRNRLIVAPALGERHVKPPDALQENASPHLPEQVNVEPKPPQAVDAPPIPKPSGTVMQNGTLNYHSPVSGKVVLGSPEEHAQSGKDLAPHAMPPLPGQAPERPISIIFDGGSKGNPGHGYGSYALRWPGLSEQIIQLQFGNRVTNNEAEYDTLIAALEAVSKRLTDQGAALNTARLDIRGDSLLVINQVSGKWKCKNSRMQTRLKQVHSLLQQFGHWRLTHHDRQKSVDVLGH